MASEPPVVKHPRQRRQQPSAPTQIAFVQSYLSHFIREVWIKVVRISIRFDLGNKRGWNLTRVELFEVYRSKEGVGHHVVTISFAATQAQSGVLDEELSSKVLSETGSSIPLEPLPTRVEQATGKEGKK